MSAKKEKVTVCKQGREEFIDPSVIDFYIERGWTRKVVYKATKKDEPKPVKKAATKKVK